MKPGFAWLTAVAMALLAVPALPGTAQAQAAGGLEWWGPTTVGQGFHIRVPVDVHNPLTHPVEGGLVMADLDLATLLREAGWPTTPSGDRNLLDAFHLDPQSVRVVAMTDLEPRQPGTQHGRLLAVDLDLPATDLRRYEVPSLALEGSLASGGLFDPGVAPRLTVLWRVPGILQPGDHRAYMVYLDNDAANPPHPRPLHQGPLAAALQGSFWSGPGTTLFGFVAPSTGSGSVQVIGLHDATNVVVHAGPPGEPLQHKATFTVGAQQAVDRLVTPGPGVVVRVTADKPVLAVGASVGFVPSLQGPMAGTDFLVSLRHDANWEQDTLYAMAAGHETPTQVSVARVGGGGQWTTTVGGGTNPWPYTIGARSQLGPNCSPSDPTRPTPLVSPGTGLHRVRVVQGGPILLQLQPMDGLSQVPASDGAPTGTDFQAALGWSEGFQAAGRCHDTSRTGGYAAFAVEGGTRLAVTSREAGVQLDPPGSPDAPNPPGRVIAEAPAMTGPVTVPLRDRPAQFAADAPIHLYAGLHPAQVSADAFNRPAYASRATPIVHGPAGGADGGRSFAVPGPAVLLAPFPGTQVSLDVARESGTVHSVRAIAPGGSLPVADDGADLVSSIQAVANRPLVVLPTRGTSGYFAAVPAGLQATPGPAEFRGYLVDVDSAEGLDPIQRSTRPEMPATFSIKVTNRGRAAFGQSLADDVQLEARHSLGADWAISIKPETLKLASGETGTATLSVTPPKGAPDTVLGAVEVLATSLNNPKVRDQLLTVTTIRLSYEVTAWFDHPGGGRQGIRVLGAGEQATYKVFIGNTGSAADTILVGLGLPEPGWTQQLLHEGKPVTQLTLVPGAIAELDLLVDPPPGDTQGVALTYITARSQNATAVFDQITATTRVALPSDIQLIPDGHARYVAPGQNATFGMVLRNQGKGATPVDLGVLGGSDSNWGAPVVLLRSTGRPAERITPIPGVDIPLDIVVPARGEALAGASTMLRMAATPQTGNMREQFLLAFVEAAHRVELALPDQPVRAGATGTIEVVLRASNRGNLDESLALRPADLPPGWNATFPSHVLLPMGGTQEVKATLRPAATAAPGLYNVSLDLVAKDGNVTVAHFEVAIGGAARGAIGASGPVVVQPGEVARHPTAVRNDGNVPLNVTVRPQPGEPWTLIPSDARVLLPGETATIDVAWEVPRDADGNSSHRANLELDDGQGNPQVQEVVAGVHVGRAQLRVDGVRAFPGAAGTVVVAQVANDGDRPARGFRVALVASGASVGSQDVGVLAAGGNVTLTFLLASSGAAEVHVDPEDHVVERDEGDNVAKLEAPAARNGAPAAGLWAIALAIGAAGVARGSRRGPR